MIWDCVPLHDVLHISKTFASTTEQASYQYAILASYPVGLRSKGRKQGTDFRGKRLQVIHSGQFVISRTRIQPRHWALVQPEFDSALVHHTTLCFDLHTDLNKNYFAAYLGTSLFDQAASLAQTKQGRLDLRRFGRIMVPLPPPDEQQRIAEIWQYASKTLQHTADMYKSITEVKNGVANELFKRTNTKWKTKPFLDCVTFGHDRSSSYPLYVSTNGKLLRTPPDSENHPVGLIPDEDIDPHFLFYFLGHQKHVLHTAFPDQHYNFNLTFGTLRIPIPAIYEQRKIVTLFQQHDDVLHKLKIEHNALLHLVQGMMQQIFSGNLPAQEAIALLGTLQ